MAAGGNDDERNGAFYRRHDEYDDDEYHRDHDDDDSLKVFLSRVPSTFDESRLRVILERHFGGGEGENGCDSGGGGGGTASEASSGVVRHVALLYRNEERHEGGVGVDDGDDGGGAGDDAVEDPTTREHRGCAFVTFSSAAVRDEAVRRGTVRDSAADGKKRRHTIYVRPVVRGGGGDSLGGKAGVDTGGRDGGGGDDECFLWARHGRCPYGAKCKFTHRGEAVEDEAGDEERGADRDKGDEEGGSKKRRRQKCFNFRKKGRCKAGEDCPYSHDVGATSSSRERHQKGNLDKSRVDGGGGSGGSEEHSKKEKDCFNWKSKGKCRKGDSCPYRHDESVRDRALARKNKRASCGDGTETSEGDGRREKRRQPLSVRVFGLNYDTTEDDVREYLRHCGPIVEVTFPTFEDSGRSRGYCGVLFQSPRAVEKAVALDGKELHGRWLSVQAGKMFLKQWEANAAEKRKTLDEGDVGCNDGSPSEGREEDRDKSSVGEFGQRVKRRKKHGFEQ